MARREDGTGPVRPIEAVPLPDAEDPTWDRLEDQISWYDRKSGRGTASIGRTGPVPSSRRAIRLPFGQLRIPQTCVTTKLSNSASTAVFASGPVPTRRPTVPVKNGVFVSVASTTTRPFTV